MDDGIFIGIMVLVVIVGIIGRLVFGANLGGGSDRDSGGSSSSTQDGHIRHDMGDHGGGSSGGSSD